jgi:transmembrane sensor
VANPNNNFDIKVLAEKWMQGTITPEERAYFEEWYAGFNDEELKITESKHRDPEELRSAIWDKINSDIIAENPSIAKPKIFTLWPRIAAAASILIGLYIGGYFILHKQSHQQTAQNQIHDIAPGSNKATLTLANGQKIILTKGLSGQLAQQGNTLIQMNNQNAVAYNASGSKANTPIVYNTMSTARGEQSPYPLILADGTKIWLNAASSVTFPTAFTGKERRITVTGEAYVEVAHNASMPFKLIAKDQTINDIGTEFNINAYDDEPIVTTTLASGSIKVDKNGNAILIRPGQQASTNASNNNIIVKDADLDAALAWKNGAFDFNHADIKTVMRQIARWYDVDIVYDGQIPTTTITGKVHRNVNASQALSILSYLDIPFKIQGKKIIISAK